MLRVRLPQVTRNAWAEVSAIERLVTGRTAAQMLGIYFTQHRKYLIGLAKRKGIDLTQLRVRGKPIPPPMPNIDRIDPFI